MTYKFYDGFNEIPRTRDMKLIRGIICKNCIIGCDYMY